LAKVQTSPDAVPKKSRLRRFVIGAAALLIVGSAVAGYFTLTRPERIRRKAEEFLKQFVNGRVRIDSARFSWPRGLLLRDVSIAAASEAELDEHSTDASIPVFKFPRIELKLGLWSALWGHARIDSVVAREPTLTVVRDAAAQRINLETMFRGFVFSKDRPVGAALPVLDLRSARINVLSMSNGGVHTIDELVVDLRGRASKRLGGYDVVWEARESSPGMGHFRIDSNRKTIQNVQGGLPWISADTAQLLVTALNPEARQWAESLNLRGRVRLADYLLSLHESGAALPQANVALANVSFTVPIDQEDVSLEPRDRYLRFHDLDGSLDYTPEGSVVQFHGRLRGSPVHASARAEGDVWRSPAQAAFDLELRVQDFELPGSDLNAAPSEARMVRRIRALEVLRRNYDPQGPVDLEMEITKAAGDGEKIDIAQARLTANGGGLCSRFFPYSFEGVTGSVWFDGRSLWVDHVCGTHGHAEACVDGWVKEVQPCAPAELRFTGRSVAIDDELLSAVPEVFREAHEVFEPQGTFDAVVSLRREGCTAGSAERWTAETEIAFDGLIAQHESFPVPIEDLSGRLRIAKDCVSTSSLRGSAAGAELSVNGEIQFEGRQISRIDVRLDWIGVGMDSNLTEKLPEPLGRTINSMDAKGFFDLTNHMRKDCPAGAPHQVAVVSLRGVSIRPEAFRVPVHSIVGPLRWENDRIEIGPLLGKLGRAHLTIDGTFPLTVSPAILNIRVQGLELNPELREALDPTNRERLAPWTMEGPLDVETKLQLDPGDSWAIADHSTIFALNGVTIRHVAIPRPVEHVRGQLQVDGNRLETDGPVQARYAGGDISLSGRTCFSAACDPPRIRIQASELSLDDSVRGLLSEELSNVWDRIRPSGRLSGHVDLEQNRRAPPIGSSPWTLGGQIDFAGAEAPGLLGAREIDGSTAISGRWESPGRHLQLNGLLGLSTLEIQGHRIKDASALWSWRRDERKATLVMDPILGTFCGGSISGRLECAIDGGEASYSLTAMGRDVDIETFVNRAAPGETPREPLDVSGLADLRVNVSGTVGDPASRRGTGGIQIRDGRLYRTPLILAILNVINLTIPNDEVLDDVHAEFYVVGNEVELTELHLRGKGLALIGNGRISLRDWTVDLNLVHISPHRWAQLPFVADLIETASRELVELHVTGPLSRPVVRTRPFRGLTDQLQSLVRKKAKKPASERP
jgi:hypothetical protein